MWIGHDDNAPTDGITGGGVPAQIWQSYMTDAHVGVPIAMLPGTDAQSLEQLNPAAIIANQAIPGVGADGIALPVPQMQAVGRSANPDDPSAIVLPPPGQPNPIAQFLGSIF